MAVDVDDFQTEYVDLVKEVMEVPMSLEWMWHQPLNNKLLQPRY